MATKCKRMKALSTMKGSTKFKKQVHHLTNDEATTVFSPTYHKVFWNVLVLDNELLDLFSGTPVSRHYKDTKEEKNQLTGWYEGLCVLQKSWWLTSKASGAHKRNWRVQKPARLEESRQKKAENKELSFKKKITDDDPSQRFQRADVHLSPLSVIWSAYAN